MEEEEVLSRKLRGSLAEAEGRALHEKVVRRACIQYLVMVVSRRQTIWKPTSVKPERETNGSSCIACSTQPLQESVCLLLSRPR